jgi:amidase
MEAYLGHIGRLNPIANVITLRSRAGLIARARHRDAQLRRGEYLGWMHGLPMVIKEYRGEATYALVSARMKSIILGDANDSPSGPGCGADKNAAGMPLNAYDQRKTAGGGAAGAAVALALRMLPVADGHDFGGSLHNPAAFNNVLGFRPSAGRIPPETHELLTLTFAARGLMARSVRDLARLFFVQEGYDHLKWLTTIEGRRLCAKPRRRVFQDSRVAWFGDLDGQLAIDRRHRRLR